jgi:hypothetical protein
MKKRTIETNLVLELIETGDENWQWIGEQNSEDHL